MVNLKNVERNLITYCAVSVVKHTIHHLEEFEKAIQEMDEVLECYTIAGGHDYLLKIIVRDMDSYQDFIINKLSRMEVISQVNSQFVIKHVKFSTAVKV